MKTIFSDDRKYRYSLWREWGNARKDGYAMFICLNPSTADEKKNDPTVRRCINFAQRWGYGGFCMTNLFAFRGTNPQNLLLEEKPVGRHNDFFIKQMETNASVVVAAWGTYGNYRNRDVKVMRFIRDSKLRYLKLTKHGFPQHPLYLRKDIKPKKWNSR